MGLRRHWALGQRERQNIFNVILKVKRLSAVWAGARAGGWMK